MTEDNLPGTSIADQRKRLIEHLQKGPLSTFEARLINVMHPAARIQELRNAGYPIQTHRRTLYDDQGRKHRAVAVYYLSAA